MQGEGLILKVDGKTAWMDSHHWELGNGIFTSPIRSIVKQNKDTLDIDFELWQRDGKSDNGMPDVDHIAVYIK